ncbi:Hydrogenase-4 component B [Phycisphaerae bacterium RAS1]|nr:Hydrogenase-4 component B [Phycisphaerae bacterium RAS1]
MIEVPLALIFLAAGAVGSIMMARRPPAALAVALGCIGVAGLVCCGAAMRVLLPVSRTQALSVAWPLPIGSASLMIDGLSAWFLLAIGFVSAAVAIYSWGYFFSAIPNGATWAVGALLNVLVAGMVIAVCAADVVLFLIGWELMSLSAFLLVGLDHRDPQTRHGAWMYLVATHLGTAFGVIPAFGVFAARAGSTSFASFAGAFDASQMTTCVLLFFLGLLGFGAKAGIMPMHVWLPEAHPVAPSPVSALMSGVVIKTGIYGLLRLISWLPPLPRWCALVVVGFAVVTGLMGILYALTQRQYKRMLAYSSVENIGIIVLGIGLGMLGRATHQPVLAVLGFGGALVHVLNHALFKGLLFLSAGAVLHATNVGDIERLGGLARRDPRNAALFGIGCAAICALPPLNGFVGEFLIYSGLLRGAALNSLLVAAFALVGVAALALMGGLALAGFSKLFGVMFLGEPRDAGVQVHATPLSMQAGMSLLALGCIMAALGAPLLGRVFEAPLTVIGGPRGAAQEYLDTILSPLGWVSGMSLLVIGVGAGLVVLRRRQSRPEMVGRQVTWGCGYAAPTPRMQYTGSSYAWDLVHSFRDLLRSRRDAMRPSGSFAAESSLSTQTADAAVQFGYRPAFLLIARACERLWPLQHGRVQLYLMYIVATLLTVFAVEAWYSPFSNARLKTETASTSAIRSAGPMPAILPGNGGAP